MSKIEFIASTQHFNKPLDCRTLSLSVYYYQLCDEQVINLAYMLIHWFQSVCVDNAVLYQVCNKKNVNIKKLMDCLPLLLHIDKNLSLDVHGYVASSKVYNRTSLRKHLRELKKIHPVYVFGWDTDPLFGESSVDFPQYINAKIQSKPQNNDEVSQTVYNIFFEKGKIFKTLHTHPDFSLSFNATPYHNNAKLYYGNAHISFSAFSLGESVDSMAMKLLEFANQLSEQVVTLNAHIRLQPYNKHIAGSPYMHYFRNLLYSDGSHSQLGYAPTEWYPTYYLCGVEWANIISPLTSLHLAHFLPKHDQINDVLIRETRCKSTIVKAACPISEYCYDDAVHVKRVLEPALFPGRTIIPLRGLFPRQNESRVYEWCPRFDWAIVPMEQEEIEIIGSDLVYTSINAQKHISK